MATTTPTLEEQIEELERELKLRERHYPRWVKQGKTTQRAADLQLARLRAARDSLRRMLSDIADQATERLRRNCG